MTNLDGESYKEWDNTKTKLLESIDDLMDSGRVDSETLIIMKELLLESKAIKRKKSIEDYFKDQK